MFGLTGESRRIGLGAMSGGLFRKDERRFEEALLKRNRTIYFNDARHYYLFVFEPPMRMEDAWRPIDEVAGTGVNTFVYGVEREDGLFYPSRVGMRFGSDMQPFQQPNYWRVWENMQSLIDRGLDPLTVLIDRAHQKGMDFFASLRMAGYGGMDPRHQIGIPGTRLDFAHAEVRDHQFAVLRELATEYETDGVELDFAFSPYHFMPDQAANGVPVMTEYVRKISEMVRARPGGPGQVGARVLPTEQMCLDGGLDVRSWMEQGLVDYVVPLLYLDWSLDPDMPLDWLTQLGRENDVSVYGMLQPCDTDYDGSRRFLAVEKATPAHMRAAAANFFDRGVDGVYTWYMPWPLGDAERSTLTDLGGPDVLKEATKHYRLRRRDDRAAELGYDAAIPLEIPMADPGRRYEVPFYIADDVEAAEDRIRQVLLKINVSSLIGADRLTLLLNGRSLAGESCLRSYGGVINPFYGQWLEFQLQDVRPVKGPNVLQISLDGRPEGLEGGVTVEDVEVIVEYGPYPSGLDRTIAS